MLLYIMKTVKKIVKLLEEKLNLKVYIREKPTNMSAIPLAVKHQYHFYTLQIEGIDFLGVYVQNVEMSSLKKHLQIIEEKIDVPIILLVETLSASGRKYFIERHISFVSEDVIYMPRLLVYLDDVVKKKLDYVSHKKLSKLAQQLIIMILVKKIHRINTSFVINHFNVSKMSASRGLNELDALGFLTVHKQGRQKVYSLSIGTLDELLVKMRNPVMQELYVEPSAVNLMGGLYKSGYSALSYYTNITTQSKVLAMDKKLFDTYKKENTFPTYDAAYEQDFIKVELWRYAPIVYDDVVDPFSLYISLKESAEDERTQEALLELYNKLNRMIDDTRY